MSQTETIQPEKRATREETFHHRIDRLDALARPLVCHTFAAAVASLASAGAAWILLFARYAFDSLTSVLMCTIILVLLSVPGLVLLGLWQGLRDIARIRAQVRPGVPPEALPAPPEAPRAEGWKGRALNLLWKAWGRIEALLELRSQVLFIEDDLAALKSASSVIRLAASAPAGIAIAISGVLTMLLVTVAALAVLGLALEVVF